MTFSRVVGDLHLGNQQITDGRKLEMVVPYIVMLVFGGVFYVVPFLNFGQRKEKQCLRS